MKLHQPRFKCMFCNTMRLTKTGLIMHIDIMHPDKNIEIGSKQQNSLAKEISQQLKNRRGYNS